MTNQADKPSVQGLMALVERQRYAPLSHGYEEIRAYAERLACQSAAAPPIDDRARIRAEALEEAAKEAVRHTTHPDDPTNEVWQSAYNHVATEIAAAIRALVLPSTVHSKGEKI